MLRLPCLVLQPARYILRLSRLLLILIGDLDDCDSFVPGAPVHCMVLTGISLATGICVPVDLRRLRVAQGSWP